jgi:tetraacyldisaccharide 4'-kinase
VRLADGSPVDPVALGDEPAMLALAEPETPVYIGARRTDAVRLAWAWEQPDVIVADDAFQHLRLARACNVLLIDAERGLGNGRMAPWGPLREPLGQWRRADVIVLTKANLGEPEALEQRLRGEWGVTVPILRSDHVAAGLERLDGGERLAPAALAGRDVALVSGIAQPRGFARLLETLGARVGAHLAGADHQAYAGAAMARVHALLAEAERTDTLVVTTAKDAVKLRGRVPDPARLWVLALEARLSPQARAYFFALLGKFG